MLHCILLQDGLQSLSGDLNVAHLWHVGKAVFCKGRANQRLSWTQFPVPDLNFPAQVNKYLLECIRYAFPARVLQLTPSIYFARRTANCCIIADILCVYCYDCQHVLGSYPEQRSDPLTLLSAWKEVISNYIVACQAHPFMWLVHRILLIFIVLVIFKCQRISAQGFAYFHSFTGSMVGAL